MFHQLPIGASVLYHGEFLYVSSGIYGRSVNAARDLPEHFMTGYYSGKIINKKQVEIEDQLENPYIFRIDNDRFIDAREKEYSTVLRYVNSASDYESQNCKFVNFNDMIVLQLIKPIPKHGELLSWYGEDTKNIVSIPTSEVNITKEMVDFVISMQDDETVRGFICKIVNSYRKLHENYLDLKEKYNDAEFRLACSSTQSSQLVLGTCSPRLDSRTVITVPESVTIDRDPRTPPIKKRKYKSVQCIEPASKTKKTVDNQADRPKPQFFHREKLLTLGDGLHTFGTNVFVAVHNDACRKFIANHPDKIPIKREEAQSWYDSQPGSSATPGTLVSCANTDGDLTREDGDLLLNLNTST